MSFYNTGNPVPSIDPRDLDDNAKHIDEIANSTELTYTDRLGVQRLTMAGVNAEAAASASLPANLANSTDPAKGAALVGYSGRNLAAELGDMVANPRRFGAEGDGLGRLLSAKFATLADAQIFYPFATTLSDTLDWAGAQAAYNFAAANKLASVGWPWGRYKTKRKIHSTGYVSTFGQGRGFNVNSGTIIERIEGTGSSDPIFEIGSGNSLPNYRIADLTIIGDTTAATARAIVFNVTGLHKPVIERLHINYIQGTPIYIPTSSGSARPEFMTFRDINVGEDFSGYGGRDVAKAKPNDPVCTGIYIQDTSGADVGSADMILVDGCVFLGKTNGFNAAISVQARGDVLRITGTSLAGASRGIDAITREVIFDSGYLEGLTFCAYLKNTFGDSTKGVKTFEIANSLVASCRYTVNVDDTAATLNHATKGTVRTIFIYSNLSTWTDGHDVVYGAGPNSIIDVSNISTSLSNEGPTVTGCRILRSGMSNPTRVVGQLSTLRSTRSLKVEALRFPAIMVPSSDLNALDDYAETPSFLPALTFGTPGDLAVTYASRSGKATKVGNIKILEIKLTTSSFTYTTASGQLKITGLPYQMFGAIGKAQASGITYTGNGLDLQGITGNPELFVRRSGSGVTIDYVTETGVPSGSTVTINCTIWSID